MKTSTATTALSVAALASQAAAELKVVSFDITKVSGRSTNLQRRHLAARNTIDESLYNNATGGAYIANVTVGTPGQPIELILDTGSSDVWMLANTADLCTDVELQDYYGYGGCTGGTFNPDKSSTFKVVDADGFEIEYQDESGALGDYITDDLTIGSSTIKTLQMGLAYNTSVNQGIMGVGYDTNEAALTPYPSIIDQLYEQDLINIKAYSLWLNDLDASTGSILFGGIDTEKYTGPLITLNTQPEAGNENVTSFTIAWSALSVTNQNGDTSTLTNSSFLEPAILDSGTTLTYIPPDAASALYDALGAVDDSYNTGVVFVDCDLSKNNASTTVNYAFGGDGGPVIKVPIDELLIDLDLDGIDLSDYGVDLSFDNPCALGVYSTDMDGGVTLLGDTFLRSAYVVYDIQNNEIALAQTYFNSTKSNVVEIPADSSGIPYVSGVATGATVTQTATGAGAIGGTSTSTSTSTHSGSAASGRLVPAFDTSLLGVSLWSGFLALVGAGMMLA